LSLILIYVVTIAVYILAGGFLSASKALSNAKMNAIKGVFCSSDTNINFLYHKKLPI